MLVALQAQVATRDRQIEVLVDARAEAAYPIVASVFMLYALTGPRGLIRGDLGPQLQLHAGQTWPQVVGQLFANTEGIFGTAIGVSAQIVFLFVLFGAIFDKLGAGDWFMNVAQGALGGFRGGPAKASVLSSALNGIISGSAVSNVVTGGNITIDISWQEWRQ